MKETCEASRERERRSDGKGGKIGREVFQTGLKMLPSFFLFSSFVKNLGLNLNKKNLSVRQNIFFSLCVEHKYRKNMAEKFQLDSGYFVKGTLSGFFSIF